MTWGWLLGFAPGSLSGLHHNHAASGVYGDCLELRTP